MIDAKKKARTEELAAAQFEKDRDELLGAVFVCYVENLSLPGRLALSAVAWETAPPELRRYYLDQFCDS